MSGTVYGDCEEVCVGAYLFTTKKGCCDDEQSIRQMLKKKIKEMYPNMTVVQFGSGREFLLSDYNPDILLLDIQMPGENGMETAKEDIAIQAWYPLGLGDKALLEESVFTRLAEKHGKSKDKHQLKGYMDRLQDEKVENEHNN